MRSLTFALVALSLALPNSASARNIMFDKETEGFLRALIDRQVYSDYQRLMESGNRVMSMTAVVGEQANGAQLLTYFITVRQCPTGTNNSICVGGATQKIEANHSFRPGGDSYSFTSKLTFVR